ncbi:MAG: DUF1016 N-terminal domain-containing protein [Sulfurimonas sp.]|uniref:DUF1016 N-terminal domain-containing protein n=1 Tax=Sulfurimonas sp. TaxID=2022749 RepID=UPI0028CD1879|nr:DUF1016 N-terminal domain-containing protein [Sulfurimonas sp.]MDT8338779.1 DUF1016 N-terminal domain-containing protein [Sulfurimonas sp.]
MKYINNSEFNIFLKEIKQKIYSAKTKAILSANKLMIELYFDIGKEIVAKQTLLGWGKSVVEQMSKDLIDEFGAFERNTIVMSQNMTDKTNTSRVTNIQQLVGEIH